MALEYTGKEFETIRDDFIILDKNGDGRINREEMLGLLQGKKEENLDFMLKLMDADGNGTVEFIEFLEIMAFLSYNKGLDIRLAKQFFRALDKDGDDFLSVEEIQKFYEMMGDPKEKRPTKSEIEVLVLSLDTDGDRQVSFDEFLNGIDKF